MGGIIGIDWPAAKVILGGAEIKMNRTLTRNLLLVESEVISIINRRTSTPTDG